MSGKIALKRLTRSDLTIFQHHLAIQHAGKQKSINLNADVFVNQLFPALPDTDEGKTGYLGLDLQLLGPGLHGALRLQRKIIKGGSYKNWRLNGEIIPAAVTADRFDPLAPGDFVIFDFSGDIIPSSARLLFVAAAVPEDAALHRSLEERLGPKRMIPLTPSELEGLIDAAGVTDAHPALEFTLGGAIEDAALGGVEGTERLIRRRSGTTMTQETLQRARQNAEAVGRDGELLINAWLDQQQQAGVIREHTWTSSANAVAPYDFTVVDVDGNEIRLDVKSTSGPFERPLHVSMAELLEMADEGRRYDLYRVYGLEVGAASLRIAENLSGFATSLIRVFKDLPAGVTPDGVSIAPGSLPFGSVIEIRLSEEDEE
ncbi:protein NO VEIN domain-containing protein [Solidesulfovibrio sp.]